MRYIYTNTHPYIKQTYTNRQRNKKKEKDIYAKQNKEGEKRE